MPGWVGLRGWSCFGTARSGSAEDPCGSRRKGWMDGGLDEGKLMRFMHAYKDE